MKFKEYLNFLRGYFEKNRKIITIFGIGIFIALVFIVLNINRTAIDTKQLSSYSKSVSSQNHSYFNLNSETGYLYKSTKFGTEALKDFLDQKIADSRGVVLIPKDLNKNSVIDRTTESYGSAIKKEHYFLTQTLDNYPIYGSSIIVHIRNGNEIYSASGNLVLTNKKTTQKIKSEDSIKIAIEDSIDTDRNNLAVRDMRLYYYNKGLLDQGDDFTNRIAAAFYLESKDAPTSYSVFYIIDLFDGSVLYKENQIKEALNRTIHNCTGSSCSVARQEGSSPSGIADADSAYTILGDVYNYFIQNFNRDSYDALGAPYIAYVNAPTTATFRCPNAAWTGQHMKFCDGLVARDIGWHELVHALTQNTAGLQYNKQSGALNESVSDMLATSSDNNWTMGEGSSVGIIRSLSDPPSLAKNPRQPDRLFSASYYCNGLTTRCDPLSNDMCGVHVNSGIMNKAFYLMTDGGNFNGCTVSGIGRQRSSAIIYGALTDYLSSKSNFYDMYSAVQQSCADLYGATTSICQEAAKALQATEMDQQTPGSQVGPKCSGVAAKPATCSNSPTNAPISPLPSSTVTVTVSPATTGSVTTTPGPTSATTTPTTTPTLSSTPSPSGGVLRPSGSPTPTPDQYFTCVPDPKCTKNGKSIQLCPLVCTPR